MYVGGFKQVSKENKKENCVQIIYFTYNFDTTCNIIVESFVSITCSLQVQQQRIGVR
jgi:hypothetical protein